MNRDDRIFRAFVIGFAIVEAIVIAIFIAIKLHLVNW
jgi:hypothetical protein